MGKETTIRTDTICALATASGGAIAVIRVSGDEAISIVDSICSKSIETLPANRVCFTHIKDENNSIIDEVLVSIFRTPHSYTGEDSVEISCHGSTYIINNILSLLVEHGCRMALPGEYTQRAFLNGKMDLSQAEAVADLIASNSVASHRMAMSQLRGDFSKALAQLRDQLLRLTSLLELELDFSEEDVEFADRSELLLLSQQIESHISRMADSFHTGQALRQGIPVAIVGKTNVGKSTLLNRLLHDERAIVSEIHGTTRDTIEDVTTIQGVQFRFIDTAGLRQTNDTIEMIGIDRTYQAISKARIILWIIDQEPSLSEVQEIKKRCEDKALLIIRNKADLSPHSTSTIVDLHISAKHDADLSALETAIFQSADLPDLSETDVLVTNARHYEALTEALNDIRRIISALRQGLPNDLIAQDLRQCLHHLAIITGGEITSDEVLGSIFQNFCVGK